MKFAYSIVALVAAAVVKAQAPVFTNCAPANADLTIDSFTLAPYPMCRNQQVCATGTGLLSVPVTAGAQLNIVGYLFGSLVYSDINIDLCALLAAQGHPCPVPITLTAITACVLVKPSAPVNVGVVLTVSATNGGGSTLFCQTTPSAMAINC